MATFQEALLFATDAYGTDGTDPNSPYANTSLYPYNVNGLTVSQIQSDLQESGWERETIASVFTSQISATAISENGYVVDPANGFGAALYIQTVNGVATNVVIAYRGTEITPTQPIQDLWTDAQIATEGPIQNIAQFQDAQNYYQAVINTVLPSLGIDPTQVNVSFTGHSLGGTLAQYMGALTGLQAVTFNAVGIADQLTPFYNNINTQGFNITNYIVNGDLVSNTYNEVGQDYYTTIQTTDPLNPILNPYDLHLAPIATNLISSSDNPPGFTLANFPSQPNQPNYNSNYLFNLRTELQEENPALIANFPSLIVSLGAAALSSAALALTPLNTQQGIGATATPHVFDAPNTLNDLLIGTSGDDTLEGGMGANDTLEGGLGNDTYIYNAGFGTEEIIAGSNLTSQANDSGDNTIVLGAGLGAISLTMGISNAENLDITTNSTIDSIDVIDALDPTMSTRHVEHIVESGLNKTIDIAVGANDDNPVGNSSDTNDQFIYAGNSEWLSKELLGGSGNDTLIAGLGNETLVGLHPTKQGRASLLLKAA